MRLSTRRSRTRKGAPENLSDLAAWLYTDLLLGLAVAFVGAGTFRVYDKTTASSKGDTPVILTYQLSCDEVDLTVQRTTQPATLNGLVISAIDNAAIANGWKEPKPGLLNIYGGSGGGDIGIGSNYAKRFNQSVVGSTPALKNVEKVAGGDKSLATSQIRLRIYVVYKGDETKNGCR